MIIVVGISQVGPGQVLGTVAATLPGTAAPHDRSQPHFRFQFLAMCTPGGLGELDEALAPGFSQARLRGLSDTSASTSAGPSGTRFHTLITG